MDEAEEAEDVCMGALGQENRRGRGIYIHGKFLENNQRQDQHPVYVFESDGRT